MATLPCSALTLEIFIMPKMMGPAAHPLPLCPYFLQAKTGTYKVLARHCLTMAACPETWVSCRGVSSVELPETGRGAQEMKTLCRLQVCMQVKLTMRSVPMPGDAPSVPKPFLTFTCRGPNLNMVQDLPISKPHLPARAPPVGTLSRLTASSTFQHQACRPVS